jgi:hypothetical protein
MRYICLLLTVTIISLPHLLKAEWGSSIFLQLDEALKARISSPVSGQVVQGAAVIRGNTNLDGFLSYEVDFAYAADPNETLFLIQESTLPIQEGVLAVWNTSAITDGDYDLHLLIDRNGGDQVEIQVTDLRVRNYTPIDTETPTPTLPHVTLAVDVPTLTTTPQGTSTPMTTSLPPTPTSLPVNPAEVTTSQVFLTLSMGVAITVGIFTLLGAYVYLRTALHNRK